MGWIGWLGVGVAIVLVWWLLAARNGLVERRHRVENGRQQIDVQLSRRHDLIPALVDVCKGAMEFERDTMERLVVAASDAREALVKATQALSSPFDADAAPYLEAESRLSSSLSQTLALIDKHPTLHSLANVQSLQEELASTENRIAFARQHYNDAASAYNARREQFPASLFRGGHGPAPLWAAPAGHEAMPAVDLRLATA